MSVPISKQPQDMNRVSRLISMADDARRCARCGDKIHPPRNCPALYHDADIPRLGEVRRGEKRKVSVAKPPVAPTSHSIVVSAQRRII